MPATPDKWIVLSTLRKNRSKDKTSYFTARFKRKSKLPYKVLSSKSWWYVFPLQLESAQDCKEHL